MSVDSQAQERIRALFDDGAYTELDRLGCNGVITAYGMVNGVPCCAFSQNVEADGAAMCDAQSKKIGSVYSLAEKIGCPVVGIFDSNGGKLTDGINAVSAFSELIASADRLSGVVPQIAVIAGTCAATAAVWAQCSDVVIMSESGQLFVTAPSLIGGKTGNAEVSAENGTAHIVCGTPADAVLCARSVLSYLPSNNLGCPGESDCVPASGAFPASSAIDAVKAVADDGSVVEIKKDYGSDTVTAFARIAGVSTGVIAAYGKLTASDCAKAASFIGLCDAFSVPVITLVDTEGYEATADSEIGGSAKSAAVLTKAYANATTVKITLITGKAYGPAFVTFAGKTSGADTVLAFENAVISPLAPEAAAAIVYNDRILAGEDKQSVINDYLTGYASAQAVAAAGAIDDVITPENAVARLIDAVGILASKRVTVLDKKHVVLSF